MFGSQKMREQRSMELPDTLVDFQIIMSISKNSEYTKTVQQPKPSGAATTEG